MASIIVTEPEEDVRSDIRSNLETQGHEVTDAYSVEEALAMSIERPPDLVVIDLDAPDGRDWELLALVRQRTVPLVLITSGNDEEGAMTALSQGIADQLTKPIHPSSLVARVQTALEMHRLRDALNTEKRRVEQATTFDALTGMQTRPRTAELLAFTAAASARYGHPLSIVLIDLDYFNRFNTIYGADAGDRVLAEIADHLAADLRKSDIAGRWEDDSFLVILPHTDIRGARLFADRLRLTFSELPIILPNGTPATVSASFGCAQGTDVSLVLDRANAMLTQSKHSGRNAVSA